MSDVYVCFRTVVIWYIREWVGYYVGKSPLFSNFSLNNNKTTWYAWAKALSYCEDIFPLFIRKSMLDEMFYHIFENHVIFSPGQHAFIRKKTSWVFIFQKYGYWNVLLKHFIKPLFLISRVELESHVVKNIFEIHPLCILYGFVLACVFLMLSNERSAHSISIIHPSV